MLKFQEEPKIINNRFRNILFNDINTNYSNLLNFGFHFGRSGVLFLLTEIAFKSNSIKLKQEIIEECNVIILEIENSNEINFSFANGLAGFSYLLNHIKSRGINDFNEVLEQLEEILYFKLIGEFEKCNFDALHGGLSIFHVLFSSDYLQRKEINFDKQIEIFLNYLNHLTDEKNDLRALISLPHGICGFVVFLKKMHRISYSFKDRIIQDTQKLILKIDKIKGLSKYSLYPSTIKDLTRTSKLSWCYGDLSVAIMYDYINDFVNIDSKARIKEILIHVLNLKFPEETGLISDACLCHGFLGNYLIINILNEKWDFKLNPNDLQFWFDKFELQTLNDNNKVFYTGFTEQNQPFNESNATLLFGSAGSLLALLAFDDIEYLGDFLFLDG